MSNSIKDIFVYNLVKRCCRCKTFCLKSNLNKNSLTKNSLYNQRKTCRRHYYDKNCDLILNQRKNYYDENRDLIPNQRKNYYNENRDILGIDLET